MVNEPLTIDLQQPIRGELPWNLPVAVFPKIFDIPLATSAAFLQHAATTMMSRADAAGTCVRFQFKEIVSIAGWAFLLGW
jgi:hypothetical protein